MATEILGRPDLNCGFILAQIPSGGGARQGDGGGTPPGGADAAAEATEKECGPERPAQF